MIKHHYSWMLFALITFDTVMTLLAIHYWGAVEVNPLMRWLLFRSVWFFIVAKLLSVAGLIYASHTIGKPQYVKFAFWAYLVLYIIGLLALNWIIVIR
jgi:hypothetical protein